MRIPIFLLNGYLVLAAAFLAGCGDSKSTSGSASEPAMPKTESALATAADETKKAMAGAGSKIAESAKTTASDIASKFLSVAKSQGDNVLSSIGQDLVTKAKSLVDSCGADAPVKANVDSALTSLANGQDSEALAPAFQLAQGTGLTTGQVQLAKEVGNLASAFVVQRNFSSLSAGQGEVSALVSALRNGEYAATLPPLQKIMSNASLTPTQKDLIGSIADKYAPSLKQAAGSLQQGLQKLQGLPGVGK
jgi:hypothetical protein